MLYYFFLFFFSIRWYSPEQLKGEAIDPQCKIQSTCVSIWKCQSCQKYENLISVLDFNHKGEVYCVGVIFWELYARRRPFDKLTEQEVVKTVTENGFQEDMSNIPPEGSHRFVVVLCVTLRISFLC